MGNSFIEAIKWCISTKTECSSILEVIVPLKIICHELADTHQVFPLSCHLSLWSKLQVDKKRSWGVSKHWGGLPCHLNNCLKAKDGKLAHAFFLYFVSLVWIFFFFFVLGCGFFFYSLPHLFLFLLHAEEYLPNFLLWCNSLNWILFHFFCSSINSKQNLCLLSPYENS